MKGIVQCSTLGEFGGFGNTCGQFAFLLAYAEKYNLEPQIPKDFKYRKLFKNLDWIPIITKELPKTKLDLIPFGQKNINVFGYFQFSQAWDLLSYSKVKSWLQFKDEYYEMFKKERDYYIACHLRRGDYVTKFSHIYCTIDSSCYVNSVIGYGYNLKDVIWVSDNYPRIHKDCEFDFLPDFFTLIQADVLFRANSTFSVWASILGNAVTYAPLVEGKIGKCNEVYFTPGNYPKCIDDFKGASPQKPCDYIFGKG